MDEVSRNAADPLASKNLTNIEPLRLRQAGTFSNLVLRAITKGAKGNAARTTREPPANQTAVRQRPNVRLVTKYSSVAF
jgi:hypothetical protein